MAKFNVGDKVIVARKGENWNLQGKMDKWLGKVMTIRDVFGIASYWMVEDEGENWGGWIWNEEDLDPINETITIMRYGDRVSATNGRETIAVEIKSNYEDAVHETVDKLFAKEKAIHVGDIVQVINCGMCYPTYVDWVIKHINDKDKIAKYKYNSSIHNGNERYKVLAIGEHDYLLSETLAYIENVYNKECFLINVVGLKKV